MSFHTCSSEILKWMKMQPYVKEESLTDWILFYLSEKFDWLKYYAFNRHEESLIGADWEWWVLTNEHAYKFRVQAKKLKVHDDNWSLINYGNRNGTQIDLLLNFSKYNGAFPLYVLYSISKPDILEQKKIFKNIIVHKMIDWCKDCPNGCFISPAFLIYDKVFSKAKRRILSDWLVNLSVPMSIFDFGLELDKPLSSGMLSEKVDDWLSKLNSFYQISMREKKEGFFNSNNYYGFRYNYTNNNGNKIPDYLQYAMNLDKEAMRYMSEYRNALNEVDGISIIDFRDVKK